MYVFSYDIIPNNLIILAQIIKYLGYVEKYIFRLKYKEFGIEDYNYENGYLERDITGKGNMFIIIVINKICLLCVA